MRGYACIGLDNPKSAVNVGSAMRAVGVFGAAFLAYSGKRLGTGPTDTMKHYRHIPLIRSDNLHSIIPFDCVPVAVDLIDEAIPLPEYQHPQRVFYIFGAEDATLGNRILSWCRDIIYIPTSGCMNLAATVNVVLYDRMSKNNLNKEA
jgi:tRNA(Leu) C34 or U34 (ribose-2'-O)-methylase TrmL